MFQASTYISELIQTVFLCNKATTDEAVQTSYHWITTITRFFQQRVFPDRLKYSEIKPLFKKGDKTSISNYRLFSVITSFSKIIEKIIYKNYTVT